MYGWRERRPVRTIAHGLPFVEGKHGKQDKRGKSSKEGRGVGGGWGGSCQERQFVAPTRLDRAGRRAFSRHRYAGPTYCFSTVVSVVTSCSCLTTMLCMKG